MSYLTSPDTVELIIHQYLKIKEWKLRNRDSHARWISSEGNEPLAAPQNIDPNEVLKHGDLYVHHILKRPRTTLQIWIRQNQGAVSVWAPVLDPSSVRHHVFADLILSFRGNAGSEEIRSER